MNNTNLTTEYTDMKDIKHKVEHMFASTKDDINKDQIVEELMNALIKPGKRISA